jgi:predicted permease
VGGSLMLLIVAGLFVRSLWNAQRAYLGFDPNQLVNVSLDPKEVGYDQVHAESFYRDLEAKVRELPGVQSASLAFSVPMGMVSDGKAVYVEGQTLEPGRQAPVVMYNHVDKPYFDTMRIPLLRGRVFRENDDAKAPLVAIVNQSMAHQFWPGQDPVGKRFSVKGATGPFVEIVGLTGDGKYTFMGWSKEPYFYVPALQDYTSYRTLQIRSASPSEPLIAQVQNQVRALDANMPISDAGTMRQSLAGGNGFFIFRVGAILAAAIGILGLILAVVGVYGVVSFSASQRTREIGIRMAVGASRLDILRLVLRQGLVLVIGGVFCGVLLALALTRSMGTLLIGVNPSDALTFVTATVLLGGIGLWACYAPARRAMKLDPMAALRYE